MGKDEHKLEQGRSGENNGPKTSECPNGGGHASVLCGDALCAGAQCGKTYHERSGPNA